MRSPRPGCSTRRTNASHTVAIAVTCSTWPRLLTLDGQLATAEPAIATLRGGDVDWLDDDPVYGQTAPVRLSITAGRALSGGGRRLAAGRAVATARCRSPFPRPRYGTDDAGMVPAPATFPTKRDADDWLATLQADMARGTWLDPRRSGVTLATYAQGGLSARRVKGRPLALRTSTWSAAPDAAERPAGRAPRRDRAEGPSRVRRREPGRRRSSGGRGCRRAL